MRLAAAAVVVASTISLAAPAAPPPTTADVARSATRGKAAEQGKAAPETKHLLTSKALSGLALRNVGPALMSGRIADIVIHPKNHALWYVAVGSGGVWKTENAGTTWTPIFDAEGAYSIGCLTLDPTNPDIIWVGTGENVSGRHVGYGDGVYRSLNGGKTWTNMGLKASEHIARILVDPRSSNVIYVAAEGPLWSPGGERGLYKSTDGGTTWKLSLSISKDTGVTSCELDPSNPDVLYAASYQRRRTVAAFMGGGPESAIYKSQDAGTSWRKLTVGLPKGDCGKIGLAVSPIQTNVVYATIEADKEEKGFYRSTNRGESFEKRDSFISGGTGPHYYQEIFSDPNVFDRIWQMSPPLMVSTDGGTSWRRHNEKNKHGDNHAMAFIQGDPEYMLNGSDGGVYETRDGGKTWRFFDNLPVTQFYKLALDNALPFYHISGGTQDNGSQLGPSRTLHAHGITNADWVITNGADGYATAIDPTDPNVVYVEWQEGNLLRYDRRSHEAVRISPRPAPGEPPLRFNWDSPVSISPHSHTRLYYGSQYVWRSDDRGDSWVKISPDLTRAVFRLEQPIMGKTWSVDALWDHGAMSLFSTITTISESPRVEGLIYVGTDDGLIQVTEDGGSSWRRIEAIPGVPSGFFVNEIKACKHDKNTVFAAVDNHKTGDYTPYVLRSRDRGKTWTNIAGDIPARAIVWSLAQDHIAKEMLFAGTELGLYTTLDGGTKWLELSGGVPTISFRDIEIHERENDLVGASFGRGFFVLDDYSPLRQISEETLAHEALLFEVRKALQYVPLRPIDSSDKGCLGDGLYVAPNPPFGAVLTYYLKDDLKTAQAARRAEETERDKAGKPVGFPGWDRLRTEEGEDKPAIVLTVSDADGNVVRRIEGPASQGIHRLAWDLRYPAVDPVTAEEPEREAWDWTPMGPMVVAGDFTVRMAKRVAGVLTPLGEARTFTVESLGLAGLAERDRIALLAFQKKAGELQRAMMGTAAAAREAQQTLQLMKKAFALAPGADAAVLKRVVALEGKIREAMRELTGDRVVSSRSEATLPSLIDRVSAQLDATVPITATATRDYEIAAAGFAELQPRMRALIADELARLGDELEAAGAPWSPGRRPPEWKKD